MRSSCYYRQFVGSLILHVFDFAFELFSRNLKQLFLSVGIASHKRMAIFVLQLVFYKIAALPVQCVLGPLPLSIWGNFPTPDISMLSESCDAP